MRLHTNSRNVHQSKKTRNAKSPRLATTRLLRPPGQKDHQSTAITWVLGSPARDQEIATIGHSNHRALTISTEGPPLHPLVHWDLLASTTARLLQPFGSCDHQYHQTIAIPWPFLHFSFHVLAAPPQNANDEHQHRGRMRRSVDRSCTFSVFIVFCVLQRRVCRDVRGDI